MNLYERPLVNQNMLQITSYEVLGKLPDPFLCNDGHRISSPDEWPARRKELYKTVIELQYGVMPPKNEVIEVETLYLGRNAKVYKIKAGPASHPVTFRLKLIMPDNVKNPPVIVDGDLCFQYAMDKEWLNAALDQGVAWALFDRTELARDIRGEGRCIGQLYEAYPELTCGSLGAWAWGYSRVVDALEIIGLTDMNCVAFTGHSRGGKTSALAGALDERAAIVNPNATCAGACSCYRLHVDATYEGTYSCRSERLEELWNISGLWLGPEMGKYALNEGALPFDCHELKAMIAPRTLFLSEAAGDISSGPVGSWQTTMAAKEVYSFLGAEDELFWYFRPGRHAHAVEDVEMLVSLIKRRQNGKEGFDSSRFFNLPFNPEGLEPSLYDWRAPDLK